MVLSCVVGVTTDEGTDVEPTNKAYMRQQNTLHPNIQLLHISP